MEGDFEDWVADNRNLRWLLWRPTPGCTAQLPTVLFLHGAGERGSENRAQSKHAKLFIANCTKPCFILVPQCPRRLQWVATSWHAAAHTMSPEPSKPLQSAVDGLQQFLREEPHADRARIHLVGLSMGGFGAWEAAMRWPKCFASVIALCGGADDHKLMQLHPEELPAIWAFHGTEDKVVMPMRSRKAVRAMRKVGVNRNRAKLILAHGVKHGIWSVAFGDSTASKWLFSFRVYRDMRTRQKQLPSP